VTPLALASIATAPTVTVLTVIVPTAPVTPAIAPANGVQNVLTVKDLAMLEDAALDNLNATYTNVDNWGPQDIENLITCLQLSVDRLANSHRSGKDRDIVVADLGRCLRFLEGVAICHKSHFTAAVMLDRELNC
jgi:hypothetical protein